MSTATLLVQALQLAREAIDALRENATASRELTEQLRRHRKEQTPDA